MKRGLLLFMALLPVAAMGQQRDIGLTRHDDQLANSVQADSSLTPDDESPMDQGPSPTTRQKDNASQPQASKPGTEGNRPDLAGSMVGYIDNAIVGSEVILRFEDEIQNFTPDLAEVLYPRCNCPNVTDQQAGTGPPGLVTNLNTEVLHMYGEFAFNRRISVFADVPVRWIQPQEFAPSSPHFGNQGGLSDVMAGFKLAMVASSQRYVTFEVQSFFPSGNASKGLGNNHYSVQPSILYYQRLTNRLTLESELEELHSIGGSPKFAADIITYGVAPSYKLFSGDRWEFTPLVEFIGWRMLNGMVTGAPQCPSTSPPTAPCSAVSNIMNLKGGARVTFAGHNSIYVGYGRALTGLYWHLRVMRIEYRYSF